MGLLLRMLLTHTLRAEKITKAIDRAERRVSIKQGSYVRAVSRNLLRRRKKSSEPGQPPSVHPGRFSIRNIRFAVLPGDGVIVGPVGESQIRRAIVPNSATIPELLEFGGSVDIHEYQGHDAKGAWRWLLAHPGESIPPGALIRTRHYRVAARPYMSTAVEKSSSKLVELWRNSL